jgi:predicted ATP-grasp superfamily ATP-dependent carboligase
VCDKAWLYDWCRSAGVPVPASCLASNQEDLAAFAEMTSFPVVAKRSQPWLLANGRRATRTQVVKDRRELLGLQPTPSPLLLQEHIPHDCSEDWLFHAYCDASSDCLVAFTGRKIRSFPAGAGETALGHAVPNPVLEQQARRLMRQLSYKGAVSLDYRFDRRDGTYKLLDLNPRVGAIFRLFETESGVDVIRAMHLDLSGRVVPAGRQVDRVLAVEGYDVRSVWSQVRAGRLRPSEVWSSWLSVDEAGWFAADDIVPALVALGRVTVGTMLGTRSWRTHQPRYQAGRAEKRASLRRGSSGVIFR